MRIKRLDLLSAPEEEESPKQERKKESPNIILCYIFSQSNSRSRMPEGPELHLSSQFINKVSISTNFVGKILERLPYNKESKLMDMNCQMDDDDEYTLTSQSRGKELIVAVKQLKCASLKCHYKPEEWTIRFNFGMTGCFKFTNSSDIPKHAKVW